MESAGQPLGSQRGPLRRHLPQADGTFGFEEFRRDPEDRGVWTPVTYFSGQEYESEQEALAATRERVPWLNDILDAGR
jgi:hypothetical protein